MPGRTTSTSSASRPQSPPPRTTTMSGLLNHANSCSKNIYHILFAVHLRYPTSYSALRSPTTIQIHVRSFALSNHFSIVKNLCSAPAQYLDTTRATNKGSYRDKELMLMHTIYLMLFDISNPGFVYPTRDPLGHGYRQYSISYRNPEVLVPISRAG
jgi:hypothetical protein